MKLKFFVYILFLLLFSTHFFSQSHDQLLVVVLMVKDEASVIVDTLRPYVDGGITNFFIFDTGSTDNTLKRAHDYFESSGITHGYSAQEPFIDFATSRNRALELAQEQFSDAVFILMPDAEWYMHNVEGLLDFCEVHRYDLCPSYLVRIVFPGNDFSTPRLIRGGLNIRFVGVVHEVLNHVTRIKVPRDIYFELGSSKGGMEKSAARWKRDFTLLLNEYEKNPADPRTVFYVAQTYECLGDLENAYKYYEERSKMAGWDEENYETFYRLGRVTALLAPYNSNFSWLQALEYYHTAYALRPHRAEPLVRIAEHYWPQNIPICFTYIRRAIELPYPERENLFVEKYTYDYARYEIMSKSAWYLGEYALGEMGTRAALKAYELPHLYQNLACYTDRKFAIK